MMRLFLSVDRIDLRDSLRRRLINWNRKKKKKFRAESASSISGCYNEPAQSPRIAFFFLIIYFLFDKEKKKKKKKKKKKALLSECVSSRSSGGAPAKTSLDDAVRFDLTGYNRGAYLAAKLSVQLCI